MAATACNWVSLATHALDYPELRGGDVGNLVAVDSVIYATAAESGVRIVDARTGRVLGTVPPAAGSGSADDVAISGRVLFVLDARPPGALSTYTIDDPRHPVLASAPRAVPVGPFAGVSAAGGLCIVSGGTSRLTAWRYDSSGVLSGPVATADLGRGQPDVLVAHDRGLAFVSTHYWGPYFGLDVVRVDASANRLAVLATLDLEGAGFTDGGAKPANFPVDMAAFGHHTVVIANARGLTIVNVATPTAPTVSEIVDVGGSAVNVDVLGDTAAVTVAQPHAAVVLVELRGAHARIVRRIPLADGVTPAGVVLLPTFLAVAARDRGVLVYSR